MNIINHKIWGTMGLGANCGPIGPMCIFPIKKAKKWLEIIKSDILSTITILLP